MLHMTSILGVSHRHPCTSKPCSKQHHMYRHSGSSAPLQGGLRPERDHEQDAAGRAPPESNGHGWRARQWVPHGRAAGAAHLAWGAPVEGRAHAARFLYSYICGPHWPSNAACASPITSLCWCILHRIPACIGAFHCTRACIGAQRSAGPDCQLGQLGRVCCRLHSPLRLDSNWGQYLPIGTAAKDSTCCDQETTHWGAPAYNNYMQVLLF